MASASITARKTRTGQRRYVVRYRLGGRAYPVEHGGSFPTMREARIRRDLIAGELPAGRNPRDVLARLSTDVPVRTFRIAAAEYKASRVDIADETAKNLKSHLAAVLPVFGDRDPAAVTMQDVQAWISGLSLKPSSVRR